MRGFVAGFVVASLLWGGVAALYFQGALDALLVPEVAEGVAEARDAGVATTDGGTKQVKGRRWRRRQRRRRWRRMRRRQAARANEKMETGDELEGGEPRELDMGASGGEERLSPAEIDGAFGRAMPAIRRCLLLLDDGADGRGRVVFGMRVGGDGRAEAVRLSGPRPLVSGQVGSCLRQQARGINFPEFDGTETTFSYPITFE